MLSDGIADLLFTGSNRFETCQEVILTINNKENFFYFLFS